MSTTHRGFKRLWLGLSVLLLLLVLVIWLSPWVLLSYAAAFLFLWVLPGLGWAPLLPARALDPPERLVVGFALSFVVTPITILLLHYLPGPLTQVQILVAVAGVSAVPLAISAVWDRAHPAETDIPQTEASTDRAWALPEWRSLIRGRWFWLLIAALLVMGLRLVNLNYSEFQGDEATVMVRAARALAGDDSILFQHKKGPAELTLVMGTWRLTGITNEWMGRLPFAWANLLGLAAVFLLCRHLGPRRLGITVVALLAIEGYFLAFGRIVQYQSIVFALGTLGLLCLLRFYRDGQWSLVFLAVVLFAGGFMAHYDAAMALPAGLVLLGARLWADRQNFRKALLLLLVAASTGLILIGLFYLPFLQSPYMGHTSGYMSERLGAGFSNNLQASFELTAVYDSVFYIVAMLIGLGMTALNTWAKWGRLGRLLGGALLLAVAATAVWPQRWLVGQVTLAWLPHAILLLGAILAPGQSMPRRAVWVWFSIPWLFYLFVPAFPRTHIHVFFPAWAILVAFSLVEAASWLAKRSRPWRWMVAGPAVLFCLVCAYYPIMMFIDHTPEYRRTFPDSKLALYWTPYEQIPADGLFGFPYRAGWKVFGYLRDAGIVEDSFDTNEEPVITRYYTRQAARWYCSSPDLYITAPNVQDEIVIPWEQIDSEYEPIIQVTVEGQTKLIIHQRAPASGLTTYAVEDYAQLFDQATTPERVAIPEEFVQQDVTLGEFARLVGYHLNLDQAVPGGYVDLILRWEVLSPAPGDYTVFTHLEDEGTMLGQHDRKPICGTWTTPAWQPGQILRDPYRLQIKDQARTGSVPLCIGMYDAQTGDRLPVRGPDGQPRGNQVCLTDVVIRAP